MSRESSPPPQWPTLSRLYAKSTKSNGCPRSGAAPHVAGAGRFSTIRSYPRHLRTPGCPYHPLSIVLALGTQKCVKSSLSPPLKKVGGTERLGVPAYQARRGPKKPPAPATCTAPPCDGVPRQLVSRRRRGQIPSPGRLRVRQTGANWAAGNRNPARVAALIPKQRPDGCRIQPSPYLASKSRHFTRGTNQGSSDLRGHRCCQSVLPHGER